MSLTIVDRYILREVVQTWAAVMAVLLLILASNSLVHMLGKVVEGQLVGAAVLPLFFVQLTTYFVTLVPLGLYLALLLGFGRLYADSEMAALGACGIGMARLYRPVVLVGLAGALITAALSIWASPWAERAGIEITARMAERSELAGVAPGRFTQAGRGGVVLFAARKTEGGVLEEVFVVGDAEEGNTHIVRAASAVERVDEESGRRFLEFRDGRRYTGQAGSEQLRAFEFATHGIHVPRQRVAREGIDAEGMSLSQLWRRSGGDAAAELQWRLSLPLACFLLALAALPLAHTTPRKGRYGKVAIALLIYLVYSNVLVVARDAVAEETVPPAIGMWWAHALTLVAVAGLVAHRVGWRWTANLLFARGDVR